MRPGLRAAVAALLAVASTAACRTRVPPLTTPGQHEQAFSARVVRDVGARYLIHLPAGYDPSSGERWPLLLFLHGAGERGTDLARVRIHGPPKLLDERPDFPFVVVSPQAEGDSIWSNLALDALLDDVIARYAIDPDRVYGTGLSMGGYGVWQLAMEFPHRFAAIAPVSAGAVPSGACALRHLPIWVFHGRRDDIVPLDRATQLVDRIRACEGGGNVRLTVYDDAGHDAWTRTYENPELYAWLLRQRRGPAPAAAPASAGTRPGVDTAAVAAVDAAVGRALARRHDATVGAALAEVRGPVARYRVLDDEPCVRGRVASSQAKGDTSFAGEMEMAWTQPVYPR